MDGCARGKKAHSSARIRDKFSLLGRGTEPAHALLVSWPGFVIWVRVDHSLIYHEGKYSGRAAPGRCELAAGCRAMRWLSGAGQPRRGLLCAQPRACSLQPMVHSLIMFSSHTDDDARRTTFFLVYLSTTPTFLSSCFSVCFRGIAGVPWLSPPSSTAKQLT